MDLPDLLHRVEQWRRGRLEAEVVQFVGDLFSIYLAAGEDERQSIRRAVLANHDLWDVVREDDIGTYLDHLAKESGGSAVRQLCAWLIAVSLTGGCADWRDTIVVLDRLRQQLEVQGIATRIHFEEIAAAAENGNTHGLSGMSTRQLIWSAGGLIWFEGELRERAAVIDMLESRRQKPVRSSDAPVHDIEPVRDAESVSRVHGPWWRFWR